ncbi:MAG: hypothetical protein ACR2OZ_15380 [Verrucomicrobiales bacterium]
MPPPVPHSETSIEWRRSVRTRKEGWLGILLTGLACAAFLWWWFTPSKPLPPDQNDPMTWVAAAQRETARGGQNISSDYDLLVVARLFFLLGHNPEAADVAALIRHPALRPVAAEQRSADRDNNHPPASDSAISEDIRRRVQQAREAYDKLDFDGGQQLMAEARMLAASRQKSSATTAELAWVAAIEYQIGSHEAARETLRPVRVAGNAAIAAWPASVAQEFARSDAVALTLHWLGQVAQTSPDSKAVSRALVETLDQRFGFQETSELAKQAGLADPGAPLEGPRKLRAEIWTAIAENDLARARNLVDAAPAGAARAGACLTVARALLWRKNVASDKET